MQGGTVYAVDADPSRTMAGMRRVFIIENPVASRVTSQGMQRACEALERTGCRVTTVRTGAAGNATWLAERGVAQGHEIVAVYGGDGTVMQAVAGIQGSKAVLGIIPGGTANLLANNLNIPRNPVRAAGAIATGAPRTIDLVHLSTSEGSRFCAVGAGTGYDAKMMAETSVKQKERWGVGAYIAFVLRTAHRIRPQPMTITVDGRSHRHDAASALVANCAAILPPILELGPEVTIDDGVLDVVILNARGGIGAAWTVLSLLAGRETRRVRRIRGAAVRIETEEPQPVQADGDVCGCTPLEARVMPGGLQVMTPPGDPARQPPVATSAKTKRPSSPATTEEIV
ncbi:MAG: putative lipid kinase BmrU [Gammaproteobacteria bacterium]|nr:putative lipid kinase BmrU [Gammaproteobacteria bacterium]